MMSAMALPGFAWTDSLSRSGYTGSSRSYCLAGAEINLDQAAGGRRFVFRTWGGAAPVMSSFRGQRGLRLADSVEVAVTWPSAGTWTPPRRRTGAASASATPAPNSPRPARRRSDRPVTAPITTVAATTGYG
jgi:hypothetical protein